MYMSTKHGSKEKKYEQIISCAQEQFCKETGAILGQAWEQDQKLPAGSLSFNGTAFPS